ncbi:MAG: hypothetical protein CMJ85_06845 [Planctomycetes bacterium]|jgi:2-keto-4-pentenoate hydratase/2-oxohepta-3-ene-1,7-dioic acid hydratase in catechol pathway|nr:hypothetical protein [Planctomycetota bacterium]
MKMVSYQDRQEKQLGIGCLVDDQTIASFTTASDPQRPGDWFDLDPATGCHDRALELHGDPSTPKLDLDRVELLCPIAPRPSKVICIGLNYKDHAEESGMDLPERPLLFSKFPSSIAGPGSDVRVPKGCQELDYEAEFGVVVGRRASRVAVADAMDHVLGYTCCNDISARDFQFADGQWQRGKSCDTFAPIGPWIVTKDEIDDPHSLRIAFRLNGETLQDSSTDQMIFGVPELLSYISQTITLEPGDVISTGTPPGVGFSRNPPIYLKDGDAMEVDIDGIGVLHNTVRA